MNRKWPRDALAYADTVRAAMVRLGDVDATRRAEESSVDRRDVIAPVLDSLGLLDLDPWGDEDESAAAVLGVRAAGASVVAWPLPHVLAVPTELRADVGAIYLARGEVARLDHADLFGRAVVINPFDNWSSASVSGGTPAAGAPLDPFASEVSFGDPVDGLDAPAAGFMRLVLDGFWVAGALSRVVEHATNHARERSQFGTPIGSFGEIRWRIADAVLARDGLDELAMYTWWLNRRGVAGSADVLALRVKMINAAAVVLSNSHQVLGAMGLCEEHDLAVIDRHLQPVLNRPSGRLGSTGLLSKAIKAEGFGGIYEVRATTSAG